MGNFANSVFSVLLGWIRTAVNWLWGWSGGTGEGGLIAWIGQNWLTLTIILCVVCMLVDGLVHLIRWKPHKVWASFFRRLSGRREEEPQVQRAWLYADGTARTEGDEAPDEEAPPQTWYQPEEARARRTSAEELPSRYVMAFARPEESYRHVRRLHYQDEPDLSAPVKGLEDYPQPAAPLQTAAQITDHRSNTDRRKRVARLNRAQFTGPNDELEGRYRPVPPPVSKKEAYRQAFVPPQWRKPADVGASVSTEEMDDGYHGTV